jgi:hypothetical protein
MNVMKLSQASSCIRRPQGKYTSVSNAISVLIIAFQLPYAVGSQRFIALAAMEALSYTRRKSV